MSVKSRIKFYILFLFFAEEIILNHVLLDYLKRFHEEAIMLCFPF